MICMFLNNSFLLILIKVANQNKIRLAIETEGSLTEPGVLLMETMEEYDDFFLKNKATFTSFIESPIPKEKIWKYKDGKMIPHADVWKRRQEYEKQYSLSGHYYGLFLVNIDNIYPSLCEDDVYPLIIDDDFHIDIDRKVDLDIARAILSK